MVAGPAADGYLGLPQPRDRAVGAAPAGGHRRLAVTARLPASGLRLEGWAGGGGGGRPPAGVHPGCPRGPAEMLCPAPLAPVPLLSCLPVGEVNGPVTRVMAGRIG